jgi:hypothetical protein
MTAGKEDNHDEITDRMRPLSRKHHSRESLALAVASALLGAALALALVQAIDGDEPPNGTAEPVHVAPVAPAAAGAGPRAPGAGSERAVTAEEGLGPQR